MCPVAPNSKKSLPTCKGIKESLEERQKITGVAKLGVRNRRCHRMQVSVSSHLFSSALVQYFSLLAFHVAFTFTISYAIPYFSAFFSNVICSYRLFYETCMKKQFDCDIIYFCWVTEMPNSDPSDYSIQPFGYNLLVDI